jgi:hypothetical protein
MAVAVDFRVAVGADDGGDRGADRGEPGGEGQPAAAESAALIAVLPQSALTFAARRVEPWPPPAVEQLRARLSVGHAALISVLADTRLRPGEALALRSPYVGKRGLRSARSIRPVSRSARRPARRARCGWSLRWPGTWLPGAR